MEHDPAWNAWFEIQYDLTDQFKKSFKNRTEGKSKAFQAAVLFAVMETLMEEIRSFLELPSTDGDKNVNEGS